jgi:hypothetical protein
MFADIYPWMVNLHQIFCGFLNQQFWQNLVPTLLCTCILAIEYTKLIAERSKVHVCNFHSPVGMILILLMQVI